MIFLGKRHFSLLFKNFVKDFLKKKIFKKLFFLGSSPPLLKIQQKFNEIQQKFNEIQQKFNEKSTFIMF